MYISYCPISWTNVDCYYMLSNNRGWFPSCFDKVLIITSSNHWTEQTHNP